MALNIATLELDPPSATSSKEPVTIAKGFNQLEELKKEQISSRIFVDVQEARSAEFESPDLNNEVLERGRAFKEVLLESIFKQLPINPENAGTIGDYPLVGGSITVEALDNDRMIFRTDLEMSNGEYISSRVEITDQDHILTIQSLPDPTDELIAESIQNDENLANDYSVIHDELEVFRNEISRRSGDYEFGTIYN